MSPSGGGPRRPPGDLGPLRPRRASLVWAAASAAQRPRRAGAARGGRRQGSGAKRIKGRRSLNPRDKKGDNYAVRESEMSDNILKQKLNELKLRTETL